MIDTGSSGGVILSPDSGERTKIMDSGARTLLVPGYGVGGASEVRLARIERLELGGFSLARPIAALRSAGAGRVSAPGTLGNIGGAILSRFKVIFDYPRKRMILEPGSRPRRAVRDGHERPRAERPTARLSEGQCRPGSGGLGRARSGGSAGDEIETVNGTLVSEIGVPALREQLRRGGQEITLGLRRDAERITLTLRTRRLI